MQHEKPTLKGHIHGAKHNYSAFCRLLHSPIDFYFFLQFNINLIRSGTGHSHYYKIHSFMYLYILLLLEFHRPVETYIPPGFKKGPSQMEYRSTSISTSHSGMAAKVITPHLAIECTRSSCTQHAATLSAPLQKIAGNSTQPQSIPKTIVTRTY